MSLIKLLSIILILAGIFGLVYGSFSFPKEKHEARVGSMAVSVSETKKINVPAWAGVGLIFVGGALLIFSAKKVEF